MLINNNILRRPLKDAPCKVTSSKKGQSVIEVIIAVAIFVILASGAITAVLGSLLASRLAEEESNATFLASQGLAAVESIKNRDFSNLANGTYGLSLSGGVWSLTGSSEILGKFTRAVTISDVKRDVQNNVAVQGLTDLNTKKVDANVTWNFIPTKVSSVTMTTYLTNWQEASNIVLGPETCGEYCQASAFADGTCRGNGNQCRNNGETYVPGGNQFCTGGANVDSCCCR